MTPKRPYYFRAMYEWILDNQLTPHIVVDTETPDVSVPPGFSEDGRITLNLAPLAVSGFAMNNEGLEFKASFSGKLMHLYIPMHAIIAIYALENNHCLVFGPDEIAKAIIVSMEEEDTGGDGGSGGEEPDLPKRPPKGPPKLSIVK
jgi:stringent starvation protein B